MSRELYPKQLLTLVDERSLLQNTAMRLKNLAAAHPLIVCNEQHRFLVAEQLREVNAPYAHIILEPVARNTAPAIALAAFRAQQQDPDSLLLVLPSDHVVADVAMFEQAARQAFELAAQGRLVTFGIVPDSPQTGYGYIRKGASQSTGFDVSAFVEKPDLETASRYLESGDYFWNSGMFAFRASDYLEELCRHRPEIHDAVKKAAMAAEVDMDFIRVSADEFMRCPAESVDYAVMENTDRAAMVPLDAGWSDIGSWAALLDALPRDQSGNHLHGDVVVRDVKDSYVRSEHRLVSVIGLDNVIVVETADAVLVGDRDKMQQVKDVVQHLSACKRDEHVTHRKVFRPWGHYESINDGERFQVKHIEVKPGASLSLQMHHHRAEHWVVVSGTARITRDEEVFDLGVNESTYIPLGARHRLENRGTTPLRIIEIQSGAYLGEDDIVRFEDNYGRT